MQVNTPTRERRVSTNLNSVQERLRHFREHVRGLSLREMLASVNAELAEADRISLGTLSNYERAPTSGASRGGPRASFLGALKRAFPELRLRWLLLGEGPPTELGGRVQALAGREAAPAEGGLGGRLRAAHPDLELLSPEASALFLGALTRYATGEPRMELDEEAILELAADLRWLLFLPFRLWGFEGRPDYERFSEYCVAALHALALAMPSPGEGDPVVAYPRAPNRGLRERLEVGFGAGEAS